MNWQIIVGLCAIILLLFLVMLYIAATSEYSKGAGSKNRAITMLACVVAIFATLLGFVYILYLENTRIVSPVIVLLIIFILLSNIYIIKPILQDIQKYTINSSATQK